MEKIETALFCICLDDVREDPRERLARVPSSSCALLGVAKTPFFKVDSEENITMDSLAYRFLVSDGKNRWFDKSFSFIILGKKSNLLFNSLFIQIHSRGREIRA